MYYLPGEHLLNGRHRVQLHIVPNRKHNIGRNGLYQRYRMCVSASAFTAKASTTESSFAQPATAISAAQPATAEPATTIAAAQPTASITTA